MQKILGYIRRACQEFDLIEDGDRIAVGVSGGKDSLVLLAGLAHMRRFYEKKYQLVAITLDPRFGGEDGDYSAVERLCAQLDVEFHLLRTDIAEIVFDIRKESSPCSLCAKMRRGALTDLCRELGCSKLALGHHRDDAEETLLMSLFYEGRLHTFHPTTFLSRSGITQIRPMVYVPESHIVHLTQKLALPVVSSPCPVNGHTKREDIKELIDMICTRFPDAREYMLSALRNEEQYGLWEKPKD